MIPEAAVKAAAVALYGSKHVEGVSMADIRRVLEAAAPHMLVECWDDGYFTGCTDSRFDETPTKNPYRQDDED